MLEGLDLHPAHSMGPATSGTHVSRSSTLYPFDLLNQTCI